MALKYTDTDTEATSHGVKLIIYGKSGVGKTIILRTAPNPVIISAESGLLSLSRKNQLKIFGNYINIPVMKVDTLADLTEAHDAVSRADCPYSTICLDSATEIAEKVIANAKLQFTDKRQAYGELIDQMTMVFKEFRDIPGKHVVFIAKQERLGTDADTTYGVAMPGSKLGQAVPYLFDEVFHLDIGKLDDGTLYRFLQTHVDLQFDAKDRSGALDRIEEPDLTKLINKIVSQQ